MSRKLLLLSQLEYYLKIKQLFGSSIIAYWPLWEGSGSVAADISGNGRNGAYIGVDLGYPGIGDGRTCPYFDGATDYVNIYSASLAAAFNGAEGTIIIWPKVYNAAMWTDGVTHDICVFRVDGNNLVRIWKDSTNSLFWRYLASGVNSQISLSTTTTTFMCLDLTWNKALDRMRAFYNGLQTGTDQVGLGVWVGALNATRTLIGAYDTPPTYPWYGYIGYGVVLNREATPAEMAKAAQL
jgi:hypothetical protein